MKSKILAFMFVFLLSAASVSANPVQEKFMAAMKAFQSGDNKSAITLFEQTIEMYPLAQAYNFLAMAKKEDGAKAEEVISLLNKAIELDPDLTLAHDNLGKVYYGEGRFDEAKKHAQKAVGLDGNSVTARMSLAWISLMGFGETREAIDNFEAAIAMQQTDYAMFGLGMAYFMDNQRGKVLEMITQLRSEGNDKLAADLEEMIRSGKYLPAKGVKSLIAQKEAQQKALKNAPEKAPIPNVSYPVRLSGKLDQPAVVPGAYPTGMYPPAQPSNPTMDRIKQLQRNYQ